MTASRWTWLLGTDRPLVGRAFMSYAPWDDSYVCSVLVNGTVTHFRGGAPEEALEAARYATEAAHGPIREERPGQSGGDVRVARWNGGALLVAGEHCIGLLEEEVSALARGNGNQARGFLQRRVRERLTEKQRNLLDPWLTSGIWDRVPVDALFASLHPDFDYNPD